jgi:hypothetical protein
MLNEEVSGDRATLLYTYSTYTLSSVTVPCEKSTVCRHWKVVGWAARGEADEIGLSRTGVFTVAEAVSAGVSGSGSS